jgi:hypothetical protein
MQPKRTIQRINETKSWFFKKINNINKSLAKLTKRKRENTQINKIRDERGDIMVDMKETHRIIREYFENLQIN